MHDPRPSDARHGITRRQFLNQGTALAAAACAASSAFADPAAPPGGAGPAAASTSPAAPAVSAGGASSRKVVVGVMGTSRTTSGGDGRGTHLAATLATLAGVEVAYVCDVDQRSVAKAIESVSKSLKGKGNLPKGVGDFRRILDDPAVDALVVATPDHWHAPAAILACAAGKHVYVEKPCCHNAAEGELLVQAARKHNRLIQHGTQRRSWPALQEAVARLHAGDIGRVLSAKCFYYADRPTIGNGKAVPVPPWLDWSLWQGPAPEREFHDNFVPYNWHWFWHWGTGELGNNGVHMIDLARWGLGVDFPARVSCAGGKYRFPDDDQQTPDTTITAFEFGEGRDAKFLTWENRSWVAQSPLDPAHEVIFAGEKGLLGIHGGGYTILDLKGKEVAKNTGKDGDAIHLQNFIDAIRGDAKLNAEIEEGYKSALLCHLGNIAYRTGRPARLDSQTHRLAPADAEAVALWGREYRKGWEPKV